MILHDHAIVVEHRVEWPVLLSRTDVLDGANGKRAVDEHTDYIVLLGSRVNALRLGMRLE